LEVVTVHDMPQGDHKATADATDSVAGTLIALEQARTQAWLDRDRERLATLLDDDFIEINAFGRLSKAQLLDGLFPRLRLTALKPQLFELKMIDARTASLTYFCSEQIEVDGRPLSGNFHVAALYARRQIGWRLLMWQITPMIES
jgi:hypothetical protein